MRVDWIVLPLLLIVVAVFHFAIQVGAVLVGLLIWERLHPVVRN